jgi:hypothetical protein
MDATRLLKYTLHACDVVSLGRLFASAWFTRVWILQDFLLGKDIVMLMGGSSMPAERFKAALLGLMRYHQRLPGGRHFPGFEFDRDYFQKFKTVYEVFRARDLRRAMNRVTRPTPKPTMSLYQWCRLLIDRKCIDERDRIYAALGLATNDLAIVPDYGLSFADVCLDLTKRSLLAGDFSVLYDAVTPMENASAISPPSFVPSLRAAARKGRPIPLGGYEAIRYSTGLAWIPMVRSAGPASITIGGIRVGEAVFIDNFADALMDLTTGVGSPFKPQLFKSYNHIKSLFTSDSKHSHSSSTSSQLCFWRTINLGFVPGREDLPYYEKRLDFQFLDLPYRQNIEQCFQNRVFFVTSAGSFAMGPAWMREADRVVIFDGAETPFLLRRATDKTNVESWRLVGDCYLKGWMFGRSAAVGQIDSQPSPAGMAGQGNYTTECEGSEKRTTIYPEFFTLC